MYMCLSKLQKPKVSESFRLSLNCFKAEYEETKAAISGLNMKGHRWGESGGVLKYYIHEEMVHVGEDGDAGRL